MVTLFHRKRDTSVRLLFFKEFLFFFQCQKHGLSGSLVMDLTSAAFKSTILRDPLLHVGTLAAVEEWESSKHRENQKRIF